MKIAGKLDERPPSRTRRVVTDIEVLIVLNGEELYKTRPNIGRFQFKSDKIIGEATSDITNKWKEERGSFGVFVSTMIYVFNSETGAYEMLGSRVRLDKTFDDYYIFGEFVKFMVFTNSNTVHHRPYLMNSLRTSPNTNPFEIQRYGDLRDADGVLADLPTSLLEKVENNKESGVIHKGGFLSIPGRRLPLNLMEILSQAFPDETMVFTGEPLDIPRDQILPLVARLLRTNKYVNLSHPFLNHLEIRDLFRDFPAEIMLPLINANVNPKLFINAKYDTQFLKDLMKVDPRVESQLKKPENNYIAIYIAQHTGTFIRWFNTISELSKAEFTDFLVTYMDIANYKKEKFIEFVRQFGEKETWKVSKKTGAEYGSSFLVKIILDSTSGFLDTMKQIFPLTYEDVLKDKFIKTSIFAHYLFHPSINYEDVVDTLLQQMLREVPEVLKSYVVSRNDRNGFDKDILKRLAVYLAIEGPDLIPRETAEKHMVENLNEVLYPAKLVDYALTKYLGTDAINLQNSQGNPLFLLMPYLPRGARFGMIDTKFLNTAITILGLASSNEMRDHKLQTFNAMSMLNLPSKNIYMTGFYPNHVIPRGRRSWFESETPVPDGYNPSVQERINIIWRNEIETPLAMAARERPELILEILNSVKTFGRFLEFRYKIPFNYQMPDGWPLWTRFTSEYFELTIEDIYYSRRGSFEKFLNQWPDKENRPAHVEFNVQRVEMMKLRSDDMFSNRMLGNPNYVQFLHPTRGGFFYAQKAETPDAEFMPVLDMYGQKIGDITDAGVFDPGPNYKFSNGVEIPERMVAELLPRIKKRM